MKIAIPVDGETTVSGVFGLSPGFLLVDTELDERVLVENPALIGVDCAGPDAAHFLAEQGVDVVLARKIGPRAGSALEDASVRVHLHTHRRVEEALRAFLSTTES